MGNIAMLYWGMLFGAIGLAFFVYGKKQRAIVPLLSGIILSVFPYFVPNVYALVIIGIILIALPFFVRI